MDNFKVPLIMDLPVEKEQELRERANQDKSYIFEKERKIKKRYWNKKTTILKKVADFVYQNFSRKISHIEMQREFKVCEATIKLSLADLNFWSEFPIRTIPCKGEKGYVKNSLKDPEDTYEYLKKKGRTIATMEQVYENQETSLKIKQKKKVKVKNSNAKKTN